MVTMLFVLRDHTLYYVTLEWWRFACVYMSLFLFANVVRVLNCLEVYVDFRFSRADLNWWLVAPFYYLEGFYNYFPTLFLYAWISNIFLSKVFHQNYTLLILNFRKTVYSSVLYFRDVLFTIILSLFLNHIVDFIISPKEIFLS